jgi:hypothetical protein
VLLLEFESIIPWLGGAGPRFPYPSASELLECIAMTTTTRVMATSRRSARELTPCRPLTGIELCSRDVLARLGELAREGPVAYLQGEPHTVTIGGRTRVWVRPEYYLGWGKRVLAPVEELEQFLAEWLRACAGEVC